MRLYFKYLAMQLKIALAYKKTFIISLLAKTGTTVFSFVSIIFLFNKFGDIAGYTINDVMICFIVSFLGYSLSECFFRAFDRFDTILRKWRVWQNIGTTKKYYITSTWSKHIIWKSGKVNHGNNIIRIFAS